MSDVSLLKHILYQEYVYFSNATQMFLFISYLWKSLTPNFVTVFMVSVNLFKTICDFMPNLLGIASVFQYWDILMLLACINLVIASYCTVLDFIHECLFCFYFDEALAESK